MQTAQLRTLSLIAFVCTQNTWTTKTDMNSVLLNAQKQKT
jgi:hypothetical protein